jgi:hypothetical protein
MKENTILLSKSADRTTGRIETREVKNLVMLASGHVLFLAAWLYLFVLALA